MPKKIITGLLLVIAVIICLPTDGISITNTDKIDTFVLNEKAVGGDRMISLPMYWKSSQEDHPEFAEKDFDDSRWELKKVFSPPSVKEIKASSPVAWYRLHLDVDSTFFNTDIYLFSYHFGHYDLYLNGELIHSNYGQDRVLRTGYYSGLYPDPVILRLNDERQQVLSVRLSTHRINTRFGEHGLKGFFIRMTTSGKVVVQNIGDASYRLSGHLFVAGLSLAIAMIYLFLFIYYPSLKVNKYYAMFTLTIGLLLMFVARLLYPMSFASMVILGALSKIGILATVVFGTLIIKNLFPDHDRWRPRGPKIIRVLAGVGAVLTFLTPFVPREFYLILAAFVSVHWIWMVLKAIQKKKEGAWFIGLGFLVFIVTSASSLLKMLKPMHFEMEVFDLYLVGIIAMLLGMTIYLARRFAHINLDLEKKIDENSTLYKKSLNHEREMKEKEINEALMKKELDEAREKQKMMDELEKANIELKNTQSQLVQSEKMASLGTLVAGVAHEINTPIGAISSMQDTSVRAFEKLKQGLIESLGEAKISEQNLLKPVQIIDDANRVISTGSERVAEIVRRLRSFARLDEAELQEADVIEGIEDTLMLVHHELKQRIEIIKNYGERSRIKCFPRQLNQVFLNILMNASQAIKGNGTITITTRRLNGNILIEFSDTGVGIKEKDLDKIFDPGFTTKGVGVGTGLGLSICYKIISAHNGRIWATNNPEGGAKFSIELPANLTEKDIDTSAL